MSADRQRYFVEQLLAGMTLMNTAVQPVPRESQGTVYRRETFRYARLSEVVPGSV